MGKLEFRRLRQGDEQGLSRVVSEVFNVNNDPAYWDWKYFQNPAGEHMVTVAVANGKIVGIQGYVPGKLKCGSKIFLSAQNTDMAVLPEYRSGGTFLKMHSKAMEYGPRKRGALCYGFPNKTAYRLVSCLEYAGVCPIFNLTKVLNPMPYVQRKVGLRLLTDLFGSIGKRVIVSMNRKKLLLPQGFRMVEVTRFDSRFDEFWYEEAENYPIAVVRDSQYLNWRYIDCPTSYKIFCVEKDSFIEGFVVLNCLQDKEIKRGKIVDILVKWGQESVASLLLTQSVNYFIREEADVITCWMLEVWPIFDVLRKRGFVRREAPHYFCVNSYVPDFPKEYFVDPSRWYITMGDSDYC